MAGPYFPPLKVAGQTLAFDHLEPFVLEMEEIDKALQAFGPDFDYAAEAKTRAGVMVMLGHDGLARFERGLVRAEDAVAPTPEEADIEGNGGDADAEQGGSAPEPEEVGSALSDRLVIDLTAHKTMGLRDAVQADVGVALATVVHALALQVFYPGYGLWTPLQLRLSVSGLERLAPGVDDGPAGRRVRDRCEAWGARLPERAEDLWGVVFGLAPSDQLDLMACCAGVGLYAVRDPYDRRPGALAQAEALATVVGLDMTGTWSATAASYFTRVPKTRVLEAVTEAVNVEEAGRIAGFKKVDMAEAAERLVEGKGWLPPVLRTEAFAAALRDRGVEAEATPRRTRGVVRKAEPGVLRRIRSRYSQGHGQPATVDVAAVREALDKARKTPWVEAGRARQATVRRYFAAQALALSRSDRGEDRELGAVLAAFVKDMPSVRTRGEEISAKIDLRRQLEEDSERLAERSRQR